MACGSTILRTTCTPDMPSANPAPICPGRTDPTPARTISETYAAICSVSATAAAVNGGREMPSAMGKAKNVQISTTSTGIARMLST